MERERERKMLNSALPVFFWGGKGPRKRGAGFLIPDGGGGEGEREREKEGGERMSAIEAG